MDSRKVAIMTWHTHENFGTALQAGATCSVLKSLGYESDLIQYIPKPKITDATFTDVIWRCKNKAKFIINPVYASSERSELFKEFLKKSAGYSATCTSFPELHDLNELYDAFICGSDQVWSPFFFDSKYFLDFVENTNKMIAYAPSMGANKIENPFIREKMKNLISRFKYLSIREQQGAKIIKELTGQDAKIVLDPTLLMTPVQWDSHIKESETEKIQGEYIICYFLGEANKYMNYVNALSQKMGVPYYVIPVKAKQKNSNCVPFEVGPCEFVSLIKNAKYVVTDSFHGTAFAVNYNIPFTVFKRFKDNDPKNQNSRIYSFLDMLGLENRLVDYKKSVGDVLECDFSNANKKLSEIREESLNYLKNALECAVNDPKFPENVPFKITDLCCGCGACASVCKKGAISIIKKDEGFNHYSIDAEKCVNCGQCKNVCPMTQIKAPEMKNSVALYSVKSNSDETLKKSSSGGVGHELAFQLLNSGYAVCGCVYETETNSAKHIWVTPDEKEKLSLFQGSKYIQSNTAEAINEIDDVARKYKLAFFGTPCQAAAMDKILSKKSVRKDAVIVDLICHGVPSYHLWDKYLLDINKKCGVGENPEVLFRGEESDWHRRMLQVTGNGEAYTRTEQKDDFYAFFRRGLCDMTTCFDCPYRERSGADLRIGDYWGNKFINDKQGVSMVIANTDAGKEFVDGLNKVCNITEQDLDEYWSVQCPYNQHKPLIREQLIEELKDEHSDLHELRKKYCSYYDWFEKFTNILKVLKRG